MPSDLHRHHRVWLDATANHPVSGWTRDPRVARWIATGRAAVVRRRATSLSEDLVPLGIALPLADDRTRLAFVVPRRAIVRAAPPLALADVVDAAPSVHRAALLDLVTRAATVTTAFSVYGSFAWQAISGEPCVTETSDLDLLWKARDPGHVHAVIALLLAWEADTGLRADGEARFPDGGAVAWRELSTRSARVLVKRDDGVALEPPPWRGFQDEDR